MPDDLFSIPDALPILPLHDSVCYPMTAAPILVGEPGSLRLIEEVGRAGRMVGLVAQKAALSGPPRPEDLYRVG
ncbi:MAG TPA: LON peptidase substrate-binding domain-containing protein, partial [Myxococcales bacterium]|nr:LON peptidase substrate-binding domain-containing protein [Myxococcales bacterium]